MPTKRYALEAGGGERVEVSWSGIWKNAAVTLDGRLLGTFADQKELKAGQEFRLEDGSALHVQLVQAGFATELRLSRDGEPLPGSAADPAQRLATAYGVIFFIAGLSAVLGLVAGVFRIQFLLSIGVGFASLFSAAIYGVLGWFVKQRSRVALGIAIAVFIVDGALSLVTVAKAGGTPPIGGIIMRVFFLLMMFQGFPAIRALEEVESAPVAARRAPPRMAQPAHRVGAPGPAPLAGQAPAATAAPVTRVLTGEAERRRLELSDKLQTTPPAMAPAKLLKPSAGNRPVAGWGRDVAAEALRFVAHKCEVRETGLHVTFTNLKVGDVAWNEIATIATRQLPSDPPWDSRILLDVVPLAAAGAAAAPVRVLSTTFVNYGALPGGASTSRMENLRRLAAHIAERHPGLAIDPETAAFLEGGKAPARFASMAHFAEYDARFG